MSNMIKSKKEKEIITEYESQVKGKNTRTWWVPGDGLSSDAPNTNPVHALT